MHWAIYNFHLLDLETLNWNLSFDDQGLDSLDQTAIITSIEHEFHTVFEDKVFENLETFNEIKEFLVRDLIVA